jgi:hypothetical protein
MLNQFLEDLGCIVIEGLAYRFFECVGGRFVAFLENLFFRFSWNWLLFWEVVVEKQNILLFW